MQARYLSSLLSSFLGMYVGIYNMTTKKTGGGGDRRQERGDMRQETGDRCLETGDRRHEKNAFFPLSLSRKTHDTSSYKTRPSAKQMPKLPL